MSAPFAVALPLNISSASFLNVSTIGPLIFRTKYDMAGCSKSMKRLWMADIFVRIETFYNPVCPLIKEEPGLPIF
jgi:hypothetical protein